MSMFDKRLSEETRESLEVAEDSRQEEWKYPSFMGRLFQGVVEWGLLHPFPQQSPEEEKKAEEFLDKLEKLIRAKLDPDKIDQTREIPQELIDELAKIGAFAIKVPEEYGGLGLSQVSYGRAAHLLGSLCGSTSALLSAHQSIGVPQPLILFGTEEQKKKYLPMFKEGAISGFALTEPYAGSDPRTMRTTATPVEGGKYYLLNGEKLWCTNGNIADVLVVMALTPAKIVHGKEKKQITAFIVETKTPGFKVTYRCDFMGLKAIQNGLLKFENLKVPRENIILGEGDGLKLAFETLNTGRLTLPAGATGVGKLCLHEARTWAKERKQWGTPIGEHEAIASQLSWMASTVFAMDAVNQMVANMADNKHFDIRLEAAMAKLFCSEECWKVIDHAIQVRGGRGYETAPSLKGRGKHGFGLERMLRDSRVNRILEGSSEIMHLFIAREALDFHLQKIKSLFSPRVSLVKKIKVLFSAGVDYACWYPGLCIPRISISHLSFEKPLRRHMRFVRRAARQLARELFHKMLRYQKGLASKQNILNRYVDIGVDLFAISCVCSYAQSLYTKKDKQENAVDLADIFCRYARRRIEGNFRKSHRNFDSKSNSLAGKIISGKFDWLENEIIK